MSQLDKQKTNEMHLEAEQRPRAEHVLWRFEIGLGELVRNQATDISQIPLRTQEQIKRESGQESESGLTIEQLIEAAYIKTLFDLAAFTAPTEETSGLFRKLKAWCETAGIFSVRNVIAHPNRKWMRHYWHLIQSLATHPLVMELNMRGVSEALAAAESGKFESPPYAWRTAIAEIEIRNNLAQVIRSQEHGKFIGRNMERKELKRRILKRRFTAISVHAPGGLGKTALVVACLKDLARNHEAMLLFDRIIFLSAKREVLTSEGRIAITPNLDGTASLGSQIAQYLLDDPSGTWQELIQVYGETRIVLCLDNMEDLILSQRESVERLLLEEFPRNWIVILTSRIPVYHTTQIELKPMIEDEVLALARCYSHEVGLTDIDPSVFSQIAVRAESPLAARIVIDSLRQKQGVTDALLAAEKLTASFAYDKLIKALSQDARKVIEALYTVNRSISPTALSLILNWDVSRALSAVTDAERQCLIVGDDSGYSLRQSLRRDYLSIRTDDSFVNFRNKILRAWDSLLADQHLVNSSELYQESEIVDPERNLEDVQDTDLKTRLRMVLAALGTTRFDSNALLTDLQRLGRVYPQVGAVERVRALVYRAREDDLGCRASLEAAITSDRSDWRAALILAEIYRDARRYDNATELTRGFLPDGQNANPDIPMSVQGRFLSIHYTSLIWHASDRMKKKIDIDEAHRKIQEVIEATSNWEYEGTLAETWASLHATALRRSVEWSRISTRDRISVLNRALEVYRKLFARYGGVTGRARLEFLNLAGQFLYAYRSRDGREFEEDVREVVNVLAGSMDSLLTAAPPDKAKQWRKIMRQFRDIDGGCLVVGVSSDDWDRWGIEGTGLDDNFTDMVAVLIYHNPPGKDYLFAEDKAENQYFVHASKLQMSVHELNRLEVGTTLLVRPDTANVQPDLAIPVLDATTALDETGT